VALTPEEKGLLGFFGDKFVIYIDDELKNLRLVQGALGDLAGGALKGNFRGIHIAESGASNSSSSEFPTADTLGEAMERISEAVAASGGKAVVILVDFDYNLGIQLTGLNITNELNQRKKVGAFNATLIGFSSVERANENMKRFGTGASITRDLDNWDSTQLLAILKQGITSAISPQDSTPPPQTPS
jgi:hypothetical protein